MSELLITNFLNELDNFLNRLNVVQTNRLTFILLGLSTVGIWLGCCLSAIILLIISPTCRVIVVIVIAAILTSFAGTIDSIEVCLAACLVVCLIIKCSKKN